MSLGPLPNVVPPIPYRAPERAAARAGEAMDSRQHSLMVLEERLAVMNSIHQSESYTALLSFSVRFCLGRHPVPAPFPR